MLVPGQFSNETCQGCQNYSLRPCPATTAHSGYPARRMRLRCLAVSNRSASISQRSMRIGAQWCPLGSAATAAGRGCRFFGRESVVLDEATVEAGSAGLASWRTAVVIAHRLTQATAAGQVVVLDKGWVVKSAGMELVAAGGAYAALWAAWAGPTIVLSDCKDCACGLAYRQQAG